MQLLSTVAANIQCQACHQVILPNLKYVQEGVEVYHVGCLTCSLCKKPMDIIVGEERKCSKCKTINKQICKTCGKEGTKWIQAYGYLFHPECTTCFVCKKKVSDGQGFFDDDTQAILHLTCLQ